MWTFLQFEHDFYKNLIFARPSNFMLLANEEM